MTPEERAKDLLKKLGDRDNLGQYLVLATQAIEDAVEEVTTQGEAMTPEDRVDKLWGDLFGEAPALYKSVFRQDKRDIITKAIEDAQSRMAGKCLKYLAEEREACAKVAEDETEPLGPIPGELKSCSKEELVRGAIRATKKAIVQAIRRRK